MRSSAAEAQIEEVMRQWREGKISIGKAIVALGMEMGLSSKHPKMIKLFQELRRQDGEFEAYKHRVKDLKL